MKIAMVPLIITVIVFGFITGCSSLPKEVRDNPVFGKSKEADDFSKLGDANLQESNFVQAEDYYLRSLESNWSVDNLSGVVSSYHSLGNLYFTLQDYDGAIKAYQEGQRVAVILGDTTLHAKSLANLAKIRLAIGEYDKAEGDLVQALTILGTGNDGTRAIILHNRGMVAMGKEDYPTALQWFSQALVINEKLKTLKDRASNHYMMASIYNRQGLMDQAVASLQKALDLDKLAEHSPGILADLWALARLYEQGNQPELAYDYYYRHFRTSIGLTLVKEATLSLEKLRTLSQNLESKKADLPLWNQYSQRLQPNPAP